MKIDNVKNPESAFLAQEKDMRIIVDRMAANQRLRKLLYYTTPDALKKPEVSDQNFVKMFGKNIRNLPKLYIDKDVLNYIVISFDNFTPTVKNPEFRDNLVYIDILCHFDQWKMDGNELRPFRIAGEIDSMLEGARLSGIGVLEFIKANLLLINGEYGGLQIVYRAVHGEDDKKGFLNPQNEIKFLQDNGGNNG